jgi:hypothetical protein
MAHAVPDAVLDVMPDLVLHDLFRDVFHARPMRGPGGGTGAVMGACETLFHA